LDLQVYSMEDLLSQYVAELTKSYPQVLVIGNKELSEIISLETGKNITKSGLNHRFRKLKELAEKFDKL